MKYSTKLKPDSELTRVWYQENTGVIAIWRVNDDGRVSVESRDPWDGQGTKVIIRGEVYWNLHWICLGEFE